MGLHSLNFLFCFFFQVYRFVISPVSFVNPEEKIKIFALVETPNTKQVWLLLYSSDKLCCVACDGVMYWTASAGVVTVNCLSWNEDFTLYKTKRSYINFMQVFKIAKRDYQLPLMSVRLSICPSTRNNSGPSGENLYLSILRKFVKKNFKVH